MINHKLSLFFKGWIVCFLWLGLTSVGHASIESKYRFTNFSSDKGLPSVEVLGIFQQRNGFIWIATDSGISRFDGKNVQTLSFNSHGTIALTNNFVSDFEEDKQGNLWISTEDGLNRIDLQGNITHFKKSKNPHSLPINWITRLQMLNNQLWLGTGTGLVRFEADTQKFFSVPTDKRLRGRTVLAMATDGHKRLWVATDHGLGYVDSPTDKLHQFIVKDTRFNKAISDTINALLVDEAGYLWIGTWRHGLLRLNIKSGEIKQFLFDKNNPHSIGENTVSALAMDSHQRIWVGHDNNGISILQPDSEQFERIRHSELNRASLPSDEINRIMVDHSGLVWISTSSGVAIYSPTQEGSVVYHKTSDREGLLSNTIWSSVADNRYLWIGTEKSVACFDWQTHHIEHYFYGAKNGHSLVDDQVFQVAADGKGGVWVGQAKGLSHIDGITHNVTNYEQKDYDKDHIQDGEIYRLLPMPDGTLWLGNRYTGISHFDPKQNRIIKRYLYKNDDPYVQGGNFPYDLMRAANGDMVLATTNGIYRINLKTDAVQHFNVGHKGESIRVNSLTEDDQHVIWAATQGMGLVELPFDENGQLTGPLQYASLAETRIDNRIKNVLFSNNKQIWFSTVDEVGRYDRNTRRVTLFPNMINRTNWQFLEGAISQHGDDIYLGSNQGLLRLDTRYDYQSHYTAPVHLTGIQVGNKPLNFLGLNSTQHHIFHYDQNALRFSFAALDYTAPDKNHYRYKLIGYSDQWHDIGNRNNVYFTNLDAGDYRFIVQGTNSNGDWTAAPIVYTFTIKQAWWVYVIYALIGISLLLSAGVFGIWRQRIKALNKMANYDLLTGLPNRRLFNQQLVKQVEQRNTNQPFVLLYLDLDHFKQVNDLWGHTAGDEIICLAASRIKSNLSPYDILARLGGDEFGIIIDGDIHSERIQKQLSRISAKLATGYHINERWIKGSASIGITAFPRDGDTASILLKNADTAMYAAKKAGRNRFYIYNPTLSQQVTSRIKMETRLRQAVSNQTLEVHYQPKISCDNGDIKGFEALVRWRDGDRGWVSPAEFIPLAEESDLILALGEWVLKSACHQAASWYHDNQWRGTVAINVSAAQLFRSDLPDLLEQTLRGCNLPGHCIELEITETSLLAHIEQAKDILKALKALNVAISLDDFGTGFSSLNYLTSLPIDILKVDKAFVDTMLGDPKAAIVLKNIFNLASELHMKVVAEGVETTSQFSALVSYYCDYIQGYLFSPAVSASKAELMFKGQDEQLNSIRRGLFLNR